MYAAIIKLNTLPNAVRPGAKYYYFFLIRYDGFILAFIGGIIVRRFCRELRRVILAFAARIASALVGGFFGCGVFLCFPSAGIKGSTCVGTIEPRSMGCVLIGPMCVGLPLGMLGSR